MNHTFNMKKYTLIVKGNNDMPLEVELDIRPNIGDFITKNKVTSIIDRVAFDLDGGNNYIIANLHVDNR